MTRQGNADEGAGPSAAVTVNNTNPAVSIGTPNDTLINSSGSTTFVLTYDYAPTTLDSGDITVNGIGVSCSSIVVADAGTITPDVTVSGCTGNGSFTITVAPGQSHDPAMNYDLGDGPSTTPVTVDNIRPTVAIGTPSDTLINSAASMYYDVAYEVAPSPALANGDVDVIMTGTVTGCTANVTNGGTTAPRVTVSGCSGNGTFSLSVDAAQSTDAAGNTDLGDGTSDSVTVDNIPPTVTIGSPTDSLINSGATTVFTLTYQVAPTSLTADDITINGTGVTCTTKTVADETTTTPEVTMGDCSGDGSFTIAVAAGTSQDAAGNPDLGDSTSDSVTVDNTPPTITSVETAKANGTYTIGEVINIAVEFDESVILTGGTLDVGLNSTATLHIPTFSGSSTNMNYVVAAGESTPVSTPLDSSVIGLGSGATLVDNAGNAIANFTPLSNISPTSTIYIDAVLPVITSAETMDTDANGKIDRYRVTFNRNITDSTFVAGQWDVAGYTITGLDTGIAADIDNDTILYIAFTEIGGTTYDTGAKPDLTTPGTVTLTDFRGNPMAPVPDIDDVIETDTAAPIIVKASGRTGVTGLSIEFSEQVDANGAAGGCPVGGDTYNLSAASFVYTDTSGDGAGSIDSMGSDATACSATGIYTVSTVLNAEMEGTDLSTPGPDNVAPAPTAIRDMGDNWADSGRQVEVTGAVSPYVYDVYPNLKRKIRVAFSEAVDNSAATNLTSALNHANYSLAENPVESGCSAGGGGADTVGIDTATAIVDINGDGTVFELTTTAAQCGSTTYELTVDQAIIDQDDHVELVAPYIMTFLGNEQLRVVSGSNIDIQTMVVVFNKSVQAGTSTGGAELATRYHFNNTTAGTPATSAVRGTGSNVNRVTLGTSFFQKARTYMVIGANGDNLYGFNEASVGAIMTTTVVSEGAESPQESLQAYPKDRAPWVGFGTPILNFDDGPISEDPFADTSTFGYLASYGGKVYIGPNNLGNATSRMDPDGSNPEIAFFHFLKDTTGTTGNDGETNQASNDDTSRDGGIAVPPYVTIGHSGCTARYRGT